MSAPKQRIALLGATGSLGTQVARQALDAGHELSVLVRSPSRLAPQVAAMASVTAGDLLQDPIRNISAFVGGHDVLVSCAGLVTEGQRFVDLFERVVSAVEALPAEGRPAVCWFLAGAGLLEIDASGRRGLDLPKVRNTYWPHRANFERLQRSDVAWRLLCPGPMVGGPPIGIDRLRVSFDQLPAPLAGWCGNLPAALVLPIFASRVPEMIITYSDAAAFMLANMTVGGPMSRRRIGLALPAGMRGTKKQWTARGPAEA